LIDVNSTDKYTIDAINSSNRIVLRAQISSYCRVTANFKLTGGFSAIPKSLGLQSFQTEVTHSNIDFYNGSGQVVEAFILQPQSDVAVSGAGSLTTSLPPSGGTNITMPSSYSFTALTYGRDGQVIAEIPAQTQSCDIASGKSTAMYHSLNRYGTTANPTYATQWYETSNAIPTTYAYGGKAAFPETQLLSYALTVLGKLKPVYISLRFDLKTIDQTTPGTKVNLGSTQYEFGDLAPTLLPLTRPTPCSHS